MPCKIAFLGDICLTGKFDLELNPRAFEQFGQVQQELAGADYVIANLESPFTSLGSSRIAKAIHIKSPPVNVQMLWYLGVDAVTLANNHVFDYGSQGYNATLSALDKAGIRWFGTQGRQALVEKNGERFLLGGFCCLSAHPSCSSHRGVNVLTYAHFKKFLDDADKATAFPIASVHWGDENIHYPREDHVRFARLMAAEGRFILHGHHPHVVQGVEERGKSLIAYSLGNFCTDEHVSLAIRNMTVTHTEANRTSFILRATIDGGAITSYDIVPISDARGSLVIQDNDVLKKIAEFSAPFQDAQIPYRRPAQAAASIRTPPESEPARFSLRWFMYRLNYHFVGAFTKGLINNVRYHLHFRRIRRRAEDRGIS